MKKKIVAAIVVVFAVVAIGYVIIDANMPGYFGKIDKKAEEIKIEPNEWQPYKAIDPDDTVHVLRVVWAEKYGAEKTAYCKVIFRNDKEKQYRLIAPWLTGLDIERANMNDIEISKVVFDSVPAGAIPK